MSLSAWEVLGIAETTDAKAIRKAYAAGLKQNRPEQDASAFQLLTDAYEWALAHARRQAFEEQSGEAQTDQDQTVQDQAEAQTQATHTAETAQAAHQSESSTDAGVLPELGRPIDDQGLATDTQTTADNDASTTEDASANNDDPGFAFGPFFAELAEQLRKSNPLHLKEWLESHPDLYSLELKWALMPHVFDTLAHNAAELEPHNGHLETLMGFFGVDARLRRHPALAPALDFLEAGHWRVKKDASPPLPPGWENVGELLDQGNQRTERRPPQSGQRDFFDQIPGWAIGIGMAVLFALARLASAS